MSLQPKHTTASWVRHSKDCTYCYYAVIAVNTVFIAVQSVSDDVVFAVPKFHITPCGYQNCARPLGH